MDYKFGRFRRWGPNGAVVGGDFIAVEEDGSVKWGHNGDGVVNLMEVDEAKLLEEFRQLKKDRLFTEAHRAQWLEQYPDMYVAVYEEKLVGVAATVEELMEQVRAKGAPVSRYYQQFLDSDPMDLAVPG